MAFKAHLTPLGQLELTDSRLHTLRELSVTTVEELVGLMEADPAGTRDVLRMEEPQFAQLRRQAGSLISPELRRSMAEQQGKEYSLGALDPRLRRRHN